MLLLLMLLLHMRHSCLSSGSVYRSDKEVVCSAPIQQQTKSGIRTGAAAGRKEQEPPPSTPRHPLDASSRPAGQDEAVCLGVCPRPVPSVAVLVCGIDWLLIRVGGGQARHAGWECPDMGIGNGNWVPADNTPPRMVMAMFAASCPRGLPIKARFAHPWHILALPFLSRQLLSGCPR